MPVESGRLLSDFSGIIKKPSAGFNLLKLQRRWAGEWHIKRLSIDYIRSSALAKKVVLKGSTILQYEPIGENNTTKNAATESKNNIQ